MTAPAAVSNRWPILSSSNGTRPTHFIPAPAVVSAIMATVARINCFAHFSIGRGWVAVVGPYGTEGRDRAALAHLCGAAAGLCDHGTAWTAARGTAGLRHGGFYTGRHCRRCDVHGGSIRAVGNIYRFATAQSLGGIFDRGPIERRRHSGGGHDRARFRTASGVWRQPASSGDRLSRAIG